VGDEFFSSVHGPSFPNHLYTIAAQAGGAKDNPVFTPLSVGPWGCDSPSATRIAVIVNGRKFFVPPCFDFKTVADSLNNAGLSWKYFDDSEHPAQPPCVGENSTVAFVNAVMRSPLWNSTVIFLSWDDFGGFYDHVPPPQLDAWALGPRVPLLIISPFTKRGYVEHQQLEFSSVVRFIEEVCGLPFLTARDQGSADIWDAFDFAGTPQPPMVLEPRPCY
jgi:phospholipase C